MNHRDEVVLGEGRGAAMASSSSVRPTIEAPSGSSSSVPSVTASSSPANVERMSSLGEEDAAMMMIDDDENDVESECDGYAGSEESCADSQVSPRPSRYGGGGGVAAGMAATSSPAFPTTAGASAGGTPYRIQFRSRGGSGSGGGGIRRKSSAKQACVDGDGGSNSSTSSDLASFSSGQEEQQLRKKRQFIGKVQPPRTKSGVFAWSSTSCAEETEVVKTTSENQLRLASSTRRRRIGMGAAAVGGQHKLVPRQTQEEEQRKGGRSTTSGPAMGSANPMTSSLQAALFRTSAQHAQQTPHDRVHEASVVARTLGNNPALMSARDALAAAAAQAVAATRPTSPRHQQDSKSKWPVAQQAAMAEARSEVQKQAPTTSCLQSSLTIMERTFKSKMTSAQRQLPRDTILDPSSLHVMTSVPNPLEVHAETPIYAIGSDIMATCLSYLHPFECHAVLTTPLSKTFKECYTDPNELWKVLCLKPPFFAVIHDVKRGGGNGGTTEIVGRKKKVRRISMEGGREDESCSGNSTAECFSTSSHTELKHLFGQYRLLYTSFVRCMRYLERIRIDAANGLAQAENHGQQVAPNGSTTMTATTRTGGTAANAATARPPPGGPPMNMADGSNNVPASLSDFMARARRVVEQRRRQQTLAAAAVAASERTGSRRPDVAIAEELLGSDSALSSDFSCSSSDEDEGVPGVSAGMAAASAAVARGAAGRGSRSASSSMSSLTDDEEDGGTPRRRTQPMTRKRKCEEGGQTPSGNNGTSTRPKFGHSKITERLLGPSKKSQEPGHTNLPWSCAIYAVVNWMVAFADVLGIQVMCLKALPYLLEDERQRTTGQLAGLTGIVIRAMVLFPDSSELHTAAFHTLVLLARPLGGREGMLFHRTMVGGANGNNVVNRVGGGNNNNNHQAAAPAAGAANNGRARTVGIFEVPGRAGQNRSNGGAAAPYPTASSSSQSSPASSMTNGTAVILDSMRRFADQEVLQAMACWAMVNIALVPAQKAMLVRLGGIGATAHAMMMHPHSAEVQFRALFALINLVIPCESAAPTAGGGDVEAIASRRFRDYLTEKEMLDENVNQISNLVVLAMKNFCSHEAILNRACLVLHNLSLNRDYHTTLLWTPNCYQMLQWTMANYPQDRVIAQSAGGTLQRLQNSLRENDDLRIRFAASFRAQQQNGAV